MEGEFRPVRTPGFSAKILYDEAWHLRVYPTLAELRQLANRLLREQGLPAIAAWLKSSKQAGWLERSQRIELIFNPVDGSMASHESHGM